MATKMATYFLAYNCSHVVENENEATDQQNFQGS